jgi:hypothetical protein
MVPVEDPPLVGAGTEGGYGARRRRLHERRRLAERRGIHSADGHFVGNVTERTRAERIEQLARVLETVLGFLVEQAPDDRFDRCRHFDRRIFAGQRRRIGGDLHPEQRHFALGVEGAHACQHFEQDRAERIKIRARVHGLPERLLWGHVFGRAVHHPQLRQHLPRIAGADATGELANRHLGDAEIEHFDEVGVTVAHDEHDVLRLQIAVDDSENRRPRQGGGNLMRDVQRAPRLERTLLDDVAQARALDVFEHQEESAVFELAEVSGRRNVGVLDVGRGHRFALETSDHLGQARHLRMEHFDGESLAHEDVLGEVHRAHSSFPEQRLDPIALGEHPADQAEGLGGRSIGGFEPGRCHRKRACRPAAEPRKG